MRIRCVIVITITGAIMSCSYIKVTKIKSPVYKELSIENRKTGIRRVQFRKYSDSGMLIEKVKMKEFFHGTWPDGIKGTVWTYDSISGKRIEKCKDRTLRKKWKKPNKAAIE